MKLDVIEKVVRLLTVITLVVVFCIILLISFIYLSFAAVYALQPLVGSLALAFLIVSGFYLLLFGYCHFTTTLSDRTPPSQILRDLLMSK